jgi:cell division protein FtsB
VLAATYFGFSTWHYVTHNYRLAQEEDQLRRDIAQLDQEHGQLVAVRDYLESDEYVEDIARRILGLVRPGETLVIVSSSAPPVATATPSAEAPADAGPWWKDLFVQPEAAPTPGGP